ncbi:site-specific integrase [Nostoc sp. CCY 9925]|uniref:site-specific integrase n=1 Tax=Nostoc sp. CCY 9925 TaxID=3103865 RepID=UPI0039C68726
MPISGSNSKELASERHGAWLRLRGTFPPKPGAKEDRPSRQRIYPGISATPEGVRIAEKEAFKVRLSLDEKNFDWQVYTRHHNHDIHLPSTVGEWILLFEEDYFNRRRKDQQTLTTWKTEYQAVFRRLPPDEPLNAEILRQTILTTPPDTKTRKRFCICLGALAKFAEVQVEVKTLKGDYNPKKVAPRQIPDDAVIVESFHQIPAAPWRWVYGMMATYGLRNHEVFRLDLEAFQNSHICTVIEGKTGSRRVWPFHPEWVTEFDLHDINFPAVDLSRSNASLGGGTVCHYFRKYKIPFAAYNLRHAWAIRTLEYGLEISLAAQQMGHSLKVHSDLYHHWISEKQHQRAFELLLKRSDRPRPPVVNLPES